MCGVFAVYSSQGVGDLEQMLLRSANALHHRGPDAQGFYCSPDRTVGLAHRRLGVMSPTQAAQPVHNESGSIHAIVNGEFYCDRVLRQQLEQRSHCFSTQSDSEILVHLYEEYGVECLSHLRGEFAFVLWDSHQRRLFAARDRFGVKPLQYHCGNNDNIVMLASEAKALFAAGVVPAWDVDAFSFAVSSQYLPTHSTLFEGVQMLPPGCFLLAGNDELHINRYWEIPQRRENTNIAYDDVVTECSELIDNAVQCRLRSDAPVCFQLSGGLDSSSVAGIAARSSSRPIDVFSIRFPEAGYNEFDIAVRTARSLNANLRKVDVSQQELIAALPTAVKESEGLSINGHVAAKSLMHRCIREAGFKVVFTGEGADEAFFGYSHLRIDYWRLNGVGLSERLLPRNKTSRGMMLPEGDGLSRSLVKERHRFVPCWVAAKATLAHKVHQLLKPDFQRSFDSGVRTAEMLAPYFNGDPNVTQARDAWTGLALAGYILKTLGDGTEMPHSVEGRVPFLDHTLWEFLRGVPQSMMFSQNRDKPLLRDSVQGVVTDEVYHRAKHPFDAPPFAVFASQASQSFIRDLLRSDEARSQPFFCLGRVEAQLDQLAERPDERQSWDPVFMLVLSTLFIQQLMSEVLVGDCG